jgi:hypothetical protein
MQSYFAIERDPPASRCGRVGTGAADNKHGHAGSPLGNAISTETKSRCRFGAIDLIIVWQCVLGNRAL